ncbi:alpha-L-rhamnosidase N-terminal domain-containing protein [Microbacterium sp. cf046]|uniref:alpha-L-rhamnosidase N-terminal domain-containing protein n=1 Tax=Microbacterium sp. cf046 TaxID=1761803 RepID=UPI0020C8ADFE|nr:alpha-L-rhamnosidase N-terminal domain-containing protein [Microbacterium sp. cf046]
MTAAIARFRAELRDDTSAVATSMPRLTWTVESTEPGWVQAFAELRSDGRDVRLDGPDSVLVDWPFRPLAEREIRRVAVRATSTEGASTDWSESLRIEAAFTDSWPGVPIGLANTSDEAQPAVLRTTFLVDAPVRRARLFFTAFGVADFELNGQPVDAGILAPGWTAYLDRLVHETIDITAHIRPGSNAIGARLAGAWFTEKYGFHGQQKRIYGEQPSLSGHIELELESGAVQIVPTDGTWRATGDGPIRRSGIYAGEHHDLRRTEPDWSRADFDDHMWKPVRVGGAACPSPKRALPRPSDASRNFPSRKSPPRRPERRSLTSGRIWWDGCASV